jgi:hypothetical protein
LQMVVVYAKDDEAILIDQDSDADRAIAILATLGDRCQARLTTAISCRAVMLMDGAAGGLGADSLLVTWPVSCTSC